MLSKPSTKSARGPRSRSKSFEKAGIASTIDRRNPLTNIWLFYSVKNDQELQVNTDSLFSACLLLEADPTCRSYNTEVLKTGGVDGVEKQRRFSLQIARTDGSTEFCTVIDNRGKAAIKTEEHFQDGCHYSLMDGEQLAKQVIRLSSIKRGLAACKATRYHDLLGFKQELKRLFSNQPTWTVEALVKIFSPEDWPLVEAAMFRAMFSGEITADISRSAFGPHTLLRRPDFELPEEREPPTQAPREAEKSDASLWSPRLMDLSPEWRDPLHWPSFPEEILSPDQLRVFRNSRAAMLSLLHGRKLSSIEEEYGLSRNHIYRALGRAKTRHSDGKIYGWRALIPYIRTKEYARKDQNSMTASAGTRGFAGSFEGLLSQYPALRTELLNLALKRGPAGALHEVRIAVPAFHRQFLALCKAHGVKATDYPFTSASLGYKSCQRFLKSARESDFAAGARILGGVPALIRSHTGTGIKSLVSAVRPFEMVMQDGHKLDVLASVTFNFPQGRITVPISRISLEVVFEVVSRAILGYSLIIKNGTDQYDAALAIQNALDVWKPLASPIPGLVYPPGAGFPSALIPELRGAGWDLLFLDNASIYNAETYTSHVRGRVGCALNYGPPGHFHRRYPIEGLFARLEKRGYQRLPSTTGSSPLDTRRENAESKAKNLPIEELTFLVDLDLATYNTMPLDALHGQSPLEFLKQNFHGKDAPMIARTLPPLLPGQTEPGFLHLPVKVRGKLKDGRRPYVQYAGVQYRNENLSESASLIGKGLFIRVNVNDVRYVELFRENGDKLGFLTAQENWCESKHSLQLRKTILHSIKYEKLKRLEGLDWIQTYSVAKQQEGAQHPRKRVSPAAAEAAHIAHSAGVAMPNPPAAVPAPVPAPSLPLRPLPPSSRHDLANHPDKPKSRSFF